MMNLICRFNIFHIVMVGMGGLLTRSRSSLIETHGFYYLPPRETPVSRPLPIDPVRLLLHQVLPAISLPTQLGGHGRTRTSDPVIISDVL